MDGYASHHRFLVPTAALESPAPDLGAGGSRHLRVLRPHPGEIFEFFDGRGRTRNYRWLGSAFEAAGELAVHRPPRRRLTLFACVTKGARWDWTVEKAVELGAGRIVPVVSARTVVRIPAGEAGAKRERWLRIAGEAARQSDAVWLPEISPPLDFAAAVAEARGVGRVFVGALAEPPPEPLAAALARAGGVGDVGVFVGPEGDFTPEELAELTGAFTPVSFGPTVLRAETAALFALSVLAAWSHLEN